MHVWILKWKILRRRWKKIKCFGMKGTAEPLPGPSNQSLSTDSMSIIPIPSNSQHFVHRGNKRIKTIYKYADVEEKNLKLKNKKIELETIKLGKEIVKLDLEIYKLQKENEMFLKLDANLSLK